MTNAELLEWLDERLKELFWYEHTWPKAKVDHDAAALAQLRELVKAQKTAYDRGYDDVIGHGADGSGEPKEPTDEEMKEALGWLERFHDEYQRNKEWPDTSKGRDMYDNIRALILAPPRPSVTITDSRLRIKAGELSCYNFSDKHPEWLSGFCRSIGVTAVESEESGKEEVK